MDDKRHLDKVSAAGLLVALGIIYGDIGTSPLYVLRAVVGTDQPIQEDIVRGALSCIFWTITLQTTIKYVILVLRADNRGEGGTFALYALVRRHARWLTIPAIIGGSALLADSIITPPISVSSRHRGTSHPLSRHPDRTDRARNSGVSVSDSDLWYQRCRYGFRPDHAAVVYDARHVGCAGHRRRFIPFCSRSIRITFITF